MESLTTSSSTTRSRATRLHCDPSACGPTPTAPAAAAAARCNGERAFSRADRRRTVRVHRTRYKVSAAAQGPTRCMLAALQLRRKFCVAALYGPRLRCGRVSDHVRGMAGAEHLEDSAQTHPLRRAVGHRGCLRPHLRRLDYTLGRTVARGSRQACALWPNRPAALRRTSHSGSYGCVRSMVAVVCAEQR